MNDSTPARLLWRTAAAFAITGGLLFCVLAGITVTSILGRALLSMPVPGDFEIVAMGTAVAAFLCLPYCQLNGGQVRIDLFMGRVSPRTTGMLDAIVALLCATIAGAFAWRMVLGLGDALRDDDVTIILGLPLWWAYPFAICSFALLAVCCIYTASQDLRRRSRIGNGQ